MDKDCCPYLLASFPSLTSWLVSTKQFLNISFISHRKYQLQWDNPLPLFMVTLPLNKSWVRLLAIDSSSLFGNIYETHFSLGLTEKKTNSDICDISPPSSHPAGVKIAGFLLIDYLAHGVIKTSCLPETAITPTLVLLIITNFFTDLWADS